MAFQGRCTGFGQSLANLRLRNVTNCETDGNTAMKYRLFVLASAALLVWGLGTSNSTAAIVSLSSDNDTYITEHSGLGGTSAVKGADNRMFLIGQTNYRATPLVHFDLSAYEDQIVTNDATFELYLFTGKNNNASQTIELHESTAVWDEATTSWANIPGGGPHGNYDPTVLDVQSVTYNPTGGSPAQYYSWTVPAAVVQSWIDAPADNHGLVLVTQTLSGNDLQFYSKDNSSDVPQLTFDAVIPEPATLLIWSLLAGLGIAMRWTRRKK